ncbi:MAG: carboxypeptidase M32 [Eubacterium sp.]|jgi:carboxypeptidase Taq
MSLRAENKEKLKQYLSRIEYIKYTRNALLYWDKVTYMPLEAIGYRSDILAFLGVEQQRRLNDPALAEVIDYFRNQKKNDEVTAATLKRFDDTLQYVEKIPEKEYSNYIALVSNAEQVWKEANEKNDFSLLQPYLEKIFEYFVHFADEWGYEKHPYDALMGFYLDDVSVEQMDGYLDAVKPVILDLLAKCDAKDEHQGEKRGKLLPEVRQINTPKEKYRQIEKWTKTAIDMGFSLDRGRIDFGSHTTILAASPYDVRIVVNRSENDSIKAFYDFMHCLGKGIYQQSISTDLLGTLLAECPSFAMEEAVGRLYEDIIGRSKGFISAMKPYFTGCYEKEITEDEIYQDVNRVSRSLIRVEADELTYLIHIIIRYEIERGLIDGEYSVKDLREIWNEKYRKYLGVEPTSDSEGVLQDIHWAAGYVGYFPSYIVANLISAQLFQKIAEVYGNIDDMLARGDFGTVRKWLTEHVFRSGAIYSTAEIVRRATGKELSPEPFIDYLRNKYSDIINR